MTSSQSSEEINVEQPHHVGLIGTGLLGKAVGARLIEHGFSVSIWNRSVDEAQPLLDLGASWSENPMKDCERIIVCLFNSEITMGVLSRMSPSCRPGRLVIDMTTGTPGDADRLAELFEARQSFYLAAPVSGSSQQARDGHAMIMVGGDRRAYSACEDLWRVLARSVHFTGDCGSASRMKLVTNLVLGLNRAALAEGLAFADSLGISAADALSVLLDSAAASAVMQCKGEKMIRGDFSVQARLAQHHKDVRIILDEAASVGLHMPLTETHSQILQVAQEMGLGDLDNSSIIRTYGYKSTADASTKDKFDVQ